MPQITVRVQTLEEEKKNIPTFQAPFVNPFLMEFAELKQIAICERPQPEPDMLAFHGEVKGGVPIIMHMDALTFEELIAQYYKAKQRFTNLKGNRN